MQKLRAELHELANTYEAKYTVQNIIASQTDGIYTMRQSTLASVSSFHIIFLIVWMCEWVWK